MAAAPRYEPMQHREASLFSLLSGWAQQGMQAFFATQRILLDLAMRQNANVMHAVRQQLSDPHYSPSALLGEIAGEGVTNFIEVQKAMLELGKQQNELLMTTVKERVGACPRRKAAVDLLRRSVDTFIHMQDEFLKIAGKQTHAWVDSVKEGKPYQPKQLMDLSRDSMDNFVKAQKQYLDVIVEETSRIMRGKPGEAPKKMMKATELSEVARKVTESFIEAQKRWVDVAGRQMNSNVKTAAKVVDLMQPWPAFRLGDLTRETVKSYVDAQRALTEVFVKPNGHHTEKTERRPKRPVRATRKGHTPAAATA